VTVTTKLNRVNHYRYLIFMGNSNGVISYGKGKGPDFEVALNNAILHAKKNLIAVPMDYFMTFPQELYAKYNSVRMTISPNRSFNAFGNPVLAHMLLLTGITHCKFKVISKNMNRYALVMAYFKLIT
jgi:ribosomal protein S5